ncbi:hypothetical protein RM553_15240 [Zunongwangia sp. F363]|uniref:Sulfotransferase domain-containing protein n=1 Tax=Autumnicola tepida TaxID=3075595 RepID=A0ABU3CCX9_9FLAO|nr:hypothetical protein [Zunongwangia sp. F363]MDT0644190.1 hypothetical protein [Zunongwangia sp. F363]
MKKDNTEVQEKSVNREVAQKAEFRVVGLSRSGNHAIINWILNQINGRYCYLNCTEPKHNPFLTARPLSEEGKVYQTNIPDFNLKQEQAGEFSQKDYLLYNHEDCFLGPLQKTEKKGINENWLGASREKRNVLILRDPFNLFASRIKAGLLRGHYPGHGAKPISVQTLQRIYKQHAREFLNNKYLKNKVLINYNSWTSSASYRKEVAEKLGISFSDEGLREVTKVAGGSSFDGTRFSGEAHKMNLHDRWKKFAEDKEYWEMFDPEMINLTVKIFGRIPPVAFAEANILSS